MAQQNADWYRAQAADCLLRAEKTTDPRIKELNQNEAERWLRLADLIEKQNQTPGERLA
jgi:hypothetical protein